VKLNSGTFVETTGRRKFSLFWGFSTGRSKTWSFYGGGGPGKSSPNPGTSQRKVERLVIRQLPCQCHLRPQIYYTGNQMPPFSSESKLLFTIEV
jgi:hypothetical protein